MTDTLTEHIQVVIETRPARYAFDLWRFFRRHDGTYMVGIIDPCDLQYLDTADGPLFEICVATDLPAVCEKLQRVWEGRGDGSS